MRKRNEWYRIQNAAEDEATVYIYDMIDSWFGVNAQAFVRELAAITAPTIHVRINSPGGDVFDGMAIYNALRQHRSEIITHVDGLAASAASIIALAGNQVHMGTGAFFMIHEAWGVGMGNANDLRDLADTLENISSSIAGIYAARTGIEISEIEDLMAAETWFSAEEAVERGFADDIEEGKGAQASASYDLLNKYKHVPKALTEAADRTDRRAPKAGAPTERDAERALRDAGFSNSAAKAIVAGGFKAKTPKPRDEGGEMAGILAALKERGDQLATLARGN